ncbi:MAG: hypothetical protein AAGA54_34970 [Myxococcota bacterium]
MPSAPQHGGLSLLDEDDPGAALRVWIGASFVGGWSGEDPEALAAAVIASLRAAGALGSLGALHVERAVASIEHDPRFFESPRDTDAVRSHAFTLLEKAAPPSPAKTPAPVEEPTWWVHLWSTPPAKPSA